MGTEEDSILFFYKDTATPEFTPLSPPHALPISPRLMGRRTHRPDPGPAAATRRSPGEARHAARSDGCAEDPGAGDPAGGARQDQGRPRAGHGVRHRARCTADEIGRAFV